MSTILSWNPFLVCGIPHRGPGSCCGTTKKGEPCKNSIKVEDTKIGHQKLTTLAREPFDLSNLQSKLCDVAKEFLCVRWHRQQQADQVGQQWYEAAVRNQARILKDTRIASPSVATHTSQSHISSTSRRRLAESGNTDRSAPRRGIRQDSLVPPSDSSEPVQSINSFVTAAMLRTNNVPWQVSPARPAILLSATNLLAGFQNLTLQSLSTSEEVNDIHCVFCLAEDGDHANECVILRCGQCQALSHLACVEEWLERRRVGFGTSCCVCRNEGTLDALVRPLRVLSSDAGTHSVQTATDPSPDGELDTARISSPNDPSQSQPCQRSVGTPGVSVEHSSRRRSARLAGAHLPRDSSTAISLRRSVRLNSRRA